MNGSRTASGRFNPSRLLPEVSPRGNGTRDVSPILSILAIFKKKKIVYNLHTGNSIIDFINRFIYNLINYIKLKKQLARKSGVFFNKKKKIVKISANYFDILKSIKRGANCYITIRLS